ncbi:copper-binding transcription factor [Trapelia coarctata]|nr:copper-binding transcription factor [Trapelia coarctata]
MYTSDASAATNYTSSLKKSSTFHTPTSPSGEHDPILNIPSLPRRSLTSSKDLEALATGDDRITQILGAVDRSLSGLEAFSSDSQDTLVAEAHPIPLFMLHANVGDSDDMEIDHDRSSTHPSHHSTYIKKHHASDSGIGSTVSSSEASMSGKHAGMKQGMTLPSTGFGIDSPSLLKALASNNTGGTTFNSMSSGSTEGRVRTGINGLTALATGSVAGSQHALSEYACKQIQKHIILPIVGEPRLKDFHSLVKGIPYRVARKEITCLRDLEKVLLWLAPVGLPPSLQDRSWDLGLIFGAKKFSATKASFLNFCETSIQCIHTTVDYLNEHDQRRPTDRPYTNGYFLDLVEQVRQYATMLAASRARAAAESNSTGAKHPNNEERLELVGGLGQTGRVAELVRTTNDGRAVSLRTGERFSAEEMSARYQPGMKRSVSEESDEDVLRSMARRRKSAQPTVKDVQKCSDCSKVFKRPCDLTKHEKTHSRPWKCNDVTCKYHEYGWPTEKERDRHVNDKHSATPSMYRCQYSPCPYESKRESNCKQHMEKAHGWQYIRSKNNGKSGKRPQNGKAPPTPQTPQMSTPGSYIFDAPSPTFQEPPTFYGASTHQAVASGPSELSGQFGSDNTMSINDTFGPFDPNFSWIGPHNEYGSGDMTDYSGSSHRPSWDASMTNPSASLSSFETSLNPQDEEPLFGDTFDWSNMGNVDPDVTSMNIQLYTPATSIDARPYEAFNRNPSISQDDQACGQIPSLSPGAQGDTMLYTPYSMHSNDLSADEGYVEYHDVLKPGHDFALFDSSNAASSLNSTSNEGMFQDLSTFPTGWSGRGTDLAQQFGIDDMMRIDE